MNTTDYYNEHAVEYHNKTFLLDMKSCYEPFLQYVPKNGKILDAGCGTGRDTLHFLEKGYEVDSFDGSEEMVKIARLATGRPVKHIKFDEVVGKDKYDGIWCCASLLHVPRCDLFSVMSRINRLLKTGAPWFVSFKFGDDEYDLPDGRHFTCMNHALMLAMTYKLKDVYMSQSWIGKDVRPDKDIKWFNCILRDYRSLYE